MNSWRSLIIIVALSILGGLFKVLGGTIYGSRASLVDALTSIANVLAAVVSVYFYSKSTLPPDKDHHYGHYKLGYAGIIVTLITYGFVAGLVVSELAKFKPYRVEIMAPIMACLGALSYSMAIFLSRRVGSFLLTYSVFTFSELIEAGVVIASSAIGALYNYIVDYTGALILTTYIFVELLKTTKSLMIGISDVAPPASYVDLVKEFIESKGFIINEIKVRKFSDKLYHGDISVKPRDIYTTYNDLRKRVKELKEELMKELQLDASIEIA